MSVKKNEVYPDIVNNLLSPAIVQGTPNRFHNVFAPKPSLEKTDSFFPDYYSI